MAVTQATQLAEFSSGIGTAGAILEVDNVNNKIGIGTTNPQALLQVGQIIKMDGVSGVITATSFVGNVTGVATGLTGTPDITVGNIVAAGATFSGVVTYEDVTNVDSLGIVTARTGLEVTANGLVINAGVSTFAADLSMADKIVHTGDTNTAIRFPSADTFTVETSGTERFRVGSTGTVGVAGLSTATSFGAFNHLSAPFGGGTVSYTVTVASKTANHRYNGSGSSNGYLIDGVEAPFLTLTPGRTYRFVHDNTGSHPLKFYLEADKTTLYSTGVTFDNAYTEIVVSDTTPQVLHYQCTNHAYMGNAVQVNSNISGGLVGTPDIDCGTGSFTGDVDIADKIIHTGDTNTAIRFPAADTFTVETGGSEALRVDSGQRLLVGTPTTPVGTDAQYAKFAVRGNTLNTNASYLSLGNNKSTASTGTDDNLGIIVFNDNDSSDAGEYARIIGATDGANGTNDYPGKLIFSTTADGASSPTERLRITSAGNVSIQNDSGKFTVGTGDDLEIYHNGTDSHIDNNTGDLYLETTGSGDDVIIKAVDDVIIQTAGNENAIVCSDNGNVALYHNNVNTFQTTDSGIVLKGAEAGAAILEMYADEGDDNADKFRFHVTDGGPMRIQNYASGGWESNILLNGNGSVELMHDDSKKLETSSAGVTVTGTLNATTDVQINGTSAATTGKAIAMAFIFG